MYLKDVMRTQYMNMTKTKTKKQKMHNDIGTRNVHTAHNKLIMHKFTLFKIMFFEVTFDNPTDRLIIPS